MPGYSGGSSGGGLSAPVSLADLATQAQATLVGRAAGAGTGVPSALTPAQGRTIIGEVETATAGSAVTTLTLTPSATLTDGIYRFDISALSANSSAVFRICINGDTAASNYRQGYVQSDTSSAVGGEDSNSPAMLADSGDASVAWGELVIKNGEVTIMANILRRKAGATARANLYVCWHTTATEVTSLLINSSIASAINTGSFITLRRVG